MKKVHFIFIDIGLGKLNENILYMNNIKILKKLNPDIIIKIWNENELDELIINNYPEYLKLWNSFPSKFYKIDFSRYLILKLHGGFYLDLDMTCLKKLPNENKMDFLNIYISHKNIKTFNNNIIYFRDKNIYNELINFSIERYNNNKMPKSWKRRIFLFTVGSRMYHKFCKDKNMNESNINSYFKDNQTISWLKVNV